MFAIRFHYTKNTRVLNITRANLYKVNIRKGLDGLRGGIQLEEVSRLRLCVHSLQVLLLGLAGSDCLLVSLVGLLAGNDLRLAGGGHQVRSGDVQLLAQDATIDLLVDDNTNGSLVHVEHNTGSTVVVLEGHALVNGGVDLDINIVASLLKKLKIDSKY